MTALEVHHTIPTIDLERLADLLRHTDTMTHLDVALELGDIGPEVVPTVPNDKPPLLTSAHIRGIDRQGVRIGEPCQACLKAGLTPAADHGATVDPDLIRRYWSAHPDAGVGMKAHPQLVRGDADHADAKSYKDSRKRIGYGMGVPEALTARTPGGMYRRRYLHTLPEGVPAPGGGTEIFGVSWYGSSGYVVIKGGHPSGKDYAPFSDGGDIITPLPEPVALALQRRGDRSGDGGSAQPAASSEAVETFLAAHTGTQHFDRLDRRRRSVATAGDGHRHATARDQLRYGFREAVAGWYPARTLHDAIRQALGEAGWTADRFDNGEWGDLLGWAVAQVQHLDRHTAAAEIAAEQYQHDAAKYDEGYPAAYVASLLAESVPDLDPDELDRLAAGSAFADPDADAAAADLGEEFWTALPVLDRIRTAARSRRAAPTAVLGSVLARAAAFTPPSTCVPALVGGTVPLSIIVALVGSTSTGKSINDRVATDLLPIVPPGVAGPFALGSGEGAAEAFIERYSATDDTGRKVSKQRQNNYGVLFTLDEGRVLTDLGSRSGSTIVPTLCTMWTGGDPGRMNAAEDTKRTLPVGGYTFGLVSLWQPTRMAGLFDDTDGGLPGRFLFLGVNDPDVPDIAPAWPGPIDWTPPSWIASEGVTRPAPLTYPAAAVAEVDANRLAKLRGETVPPLDGHRDLGRLKIAGLLAVLDGQRNEVGDIHWKLAGELLKASDRLRGGVLAELDYERRRAEESGNAKAGRREVAKVSAVEAKAMDAAVRAIGRKAHREAPNVLPRRELTQAIKGTDRKVTGTEAPIEEAERLGYIAPADGGWIAGESRPAA